MQDDLAIAMDPQCDGSKCLRVSFSCLGASPLFNPYPDVEVSEKWSFLASPPVKDL